MRRAIELARRAWGQTHPNPMVGAAIVEDGSIVAEGWHERAGQPHAEVAAIEALGRKPAEDATLYVTLEPCSTVGRTGACTEAILRSGIRRVVVGAVDPNPEHAGRGLSLLRGQGIEVLDGVLSEDCADLNLIFNHWIVNRRPLIAAKIAITLDGKFAAASGHSRWVTGKVARENVMRWRRYFPAIAVGANTVRQDDPSLSSRLGEEVYCPRRFVFDRSLKSLQGEHLPTIFSDAFADRTIIVCLQGAGSELKQRAKALGVSLWEVSEVAGHLSWSDFISRCAAEEVHGVYLEAGPSLATTLIEQQKIDYLFAYTAPKLLLDTCSRGMGSKRETTSMDQCLGLSSIRHEVLGSDILTRGFLKS